MAAASRGLLQVTHSRLGAQTALLASVSPDVIQKIAQLLKPRGFIINNTDQIIARIHVAQKSFDNFEDYFDYHDALDNGNIRIIINSKNPIQPHMKGFISDRIDQTIAGNPLFVIMALKRINPDASYKDIWEINHVILHAYSNIYVDRKDEKIILTVFTPGEPAISHERMRDRNPYDDE